MSVFNDLKNNNPQQVLWEGELFFCLLDGFPVSPGHSLIIPHREVKSLLELDDNEWRELKNAITLTLETLNKVDLEAKYREMQAATDNEKSKSFLQEAIDFIAQKQPFMPDAYNYGVNDGTAAGRTVDHLHWHVIPRFTGDMEDPRGGVRYIFPEKGNYKKP